jgi:hypothetical protein
MKSRIARQPELYIQKRKLCASRQGSVPFGTDVYNSLVFNDGDLRSFWLPPVFSEKERDYEAIWITLEPWFG